MQKLDSSTPKKKKKIYECISIATYPTLSFTSSQAGPVAAEATLVPTSSAPPLVSFSLGFSGTLHQLM